MKFFLQIKHKFVFFLPTLSDVYLKMKSEIIDFQTLKQSLRIVLLETIWILDLAPLFLMIRFVWNVERCIVVISQVYFIAKSWNKKCYQIKLLLL
jgi:hypothetical protein